MKNGTKSALLCLSLAAIACLFTGCGGCTRDVAKEAAKAAADEVRKESREQAKKLQQQLDEAARQNQQLQETISGAQAEIERLKTDQNHRQETEEKLWQYARLFVYIVGFLTCLRLFGKPVYRVSCALLLRILPLEPRQIIKGSSDETRLEQT